MGPDVNRGFLYTNGWLANGELVPFGRTLAVWEFGDLIPQQWPPSFLTAHF